MIEATFKTSDGYPYNQMYYSKGKFLQAVAKKKDTFEHAVDIEQMIVIRPANLQSYKEGKEF